jgi:hypothetical protein
MPLPTKGIKALDGWALAYFSREILPFAKPRALLESLVEVIDAADKMKQGRAILRQPDIAPYDPMYG